jgi:hypothetical protein
MTRASSESDMSTIVWTLQGRLAAAPLRFSD